MFLYKIVKEKEWLPNGYTLSCLRGTTAGNLQACPSIVPVELMIQERLAVDGLMIENL